MSGCKRISRLHCFYLFQGLLITVLLLVITSIALADVDINTTTFPDSYFRMYMSANFDTDKSGSFSDAEISVVKDLRIPAFSEVKSLVGIEYFTALEILVCDSQELTTLDVSKNTALKELDCSLNPLTTLNVSGNAALTYLDCVRTQLATLDISKNTALTDLECWDNQLTTLDVSNNTALTILNCSYNQLTTLDVSNNTALKELKCEHNTLTNLDLSENTVLSRLICYENQMTELDVSHCPKLCELMDNRLVSNGYDWFSFDFEFDSNVTVIGDFVSEHEYAVYMRDDGNGTAIADPAKGVTGTLVTLTATANEGYKFKEWKVNSGDVTVANNKFTIGTANVTIDAIFEEIPDTAFTVTVTNDGNGMAVADPASGIFGTEVTLTATANEGYKFKEWQVLSGGVTVAENKFTIDMADVEIKAIFEKNPATAFTVTIANDGNGTATANPASGVSGTEVTLTATANAGYQFKEWQVITGGVTVANNKFTIGTANVEIKAVFEKKTDPASPDPEPDPESDPEPVPEPELDPYPQVIAGPVTWDHLHYKFLNSAEDLHVGRYETIPLSIYLMHYSYPKAMQLFLGNAWGDLWDGFGGYCQGISGTAILFNISGSGLSLSDFHVSKVSDLNYNSSSSSILSVGSITVKQLIESFQVMQWMERFDQSRIYGIDQVVKKVEAGIKNGRLPCIIFSNKHAVVGCKIEHLNETTDLLYLYDSSQHNNGQPVETWLTLTKNADGHYTGWKYVKPNGTVLYDSEHERINCIEAASFIDMWAAANKSGLTSAIRGNKTIDGERQYTLVSGSNWQITSSGSVQAEMVNGSFNAPNSRFSRNSGALPNHYTLVYSDDSSFTVTNTGSGDSFHVSTAGSHQGAIVSTQAKAVTFINNDSEGMNKVILDTAPGDQFDIELISQLKAASGKEDVHITGQSDGAQVEVGMSGSDWVLDNCSDVQVTVNGETVSNPEDVFGKNINLYEIKLKFSEAVYTGEKIKPGISVKGAKLTEGQDYKITYENNIGSDQKDIVAAATVTGIGDYCGTKTLNFTIKGTTTSIKVKGIEYQIRKGKATVIGISSSKATVSIPDTIKVGSQKIKVTAIGDGAFKNDKKLAKLTIGKNVSQIGKKAFNNCKKLKAITIKTTKLTKKTIGKDSFKGISKKAQFKCPKKMLKKYTTWLKKPGGAPKTAKFKK